MVGKASNVRSRLIDTLVILTWKRLDGQWSQKAKNSFKAEVVLFTDVLAYWSRPALGTRDTGTGLVTGGIIFPSHSGKTDD